jgi:predicted CoA-binding protein
MPQNPDDQTIRQILTDTRTVAVVGWSPNAGRPSHGVADFLRARGMRVIPINPGQAGQSHGGETIRARLGDIPASDRVEMVDIFRRSDAVAAVVDEALATLPALKVIWMQIGVQDEAAAARARAKGIVVVQGRCPKIESRRLELA